MRLLCIALALFALASGAGCSSQEFSQDGGDLKRAEVDVISTRMRDAIEREHPLLKHKLVNRYVDTIGQSIVSRNPEMPPLPYEFRVLRTNEVLVFSLPGGIVYVSLGLLRAVELEGQLAAAISHELAHQQLNHPLVVWRRKVNSNRGQRYILDFSGDWKGNFLGDRGALYMGKEMEEEADRQSAVILYKAGFDPRVYISYLQVLRKLEVAKTADVAAMISLHPPLLQRMAWAKEALAKLPPRKEASLSSATFQQIKSILREAAKKSGKSEREKEEP
jgi:beta-barrel assembly-enhancing protease